MRRVVAGFVAASLIFGARQLWSQQGQRTAAGSGSDGTGHTIAEPIRASYRAPAACPSEGQFVERVFARTSHARLAAPGEAARSFAVDVSVADASFVGRLTIGSVDGTAVVRTLAAASCDELVGAMALVVALAVDPQALRASGSPGASPASAAESGDTDAAAVSAGGGADRPDAGAPADAGPTPAAAMDASRGEAPIGERSPKSALADAGADGALGALPPPNPARGVALAPGRRDAGDALGSDRATPAPRSGTLPSAWRWAVGAEGVGTLGTGPDQPASWAGGGGVFVELFEARARVLAPAFRLSVVAREGRPEFHGVTAELVWRVAQLDVCPVLVRPGAALRVAACLGAEAGELRASASGRSGSHPWWAPDAGTRAAWVPIEGWRLELTASALVPVEHYRFLYETDGNLQWIGGIEPVAVNVGLGLAVELP